MSEEEFFERAINRICKDYDYNYATELKNIYLKKDKEIERLKEENEFLKLSNPEMNLEHWRIVDENKRKINNLRENNRQLKSQLQQKENIIKELNDKIEDDKMIIEGNWGCIDNLRKDYNLQKNIIKEVREYVNTDKNCIPKHIKDYINNLLDKEVN